MSRRKKESAVRGIWRDWGLTIVLLAVFAAALLGQVLSGWGVYNEEMTDAARPRISVVRYVGTPHFAEALFENWESEFLQMGALVLLTVFLRQKGSPESQSPAVPPGLDAGARRKRTPSDAPRAVGQWFYENSLGLALVMLFAFSFVFHVVGGAAEFNRQAVLEGRSTVSTLGFLLTSQMWFESMQNWQSEFLSSAALVLLTVWLRQKGSPESKPVEDAKDQLSLR